MYVEQTTRLEACLHKLAALMCCRQSAGAQQELCCAHTCRGTGQMTSL